MEKAPFHHDLADGPSDVQSVWRRASDGVRLRVTYWPADDAKGTILLYSGRTEYAEKYGRTARDLTEGGYAVLTIDWRGQGLSDRIAQDPRLGHVNGFLDYQLDVTELLAVAEELTCPAPRYMIAHSMGGCIGLRSLVEGLHVEKAVFSAPMWGINLPMWVRPVPYVLPQILRAFGVKEKLAPGTQIENYVLATEFSENMLTSDRETFDYLARHAEAIEEFALGGPSIDWVGYGAWETRSLRKAKRPKLPVLTFLGAEEEIVSSSAIREVHRNWASGELRIVEGARHEIMMEAPAARGRFLNETLAFFQSA